MIKAQTKSLNNLTNYFNTRLFQLDMLTKLRRRKVIKLVKSNKLKAIG